MLHRHRGFNFPLKELKHLKPPCYFDACAWRIMHNPCVRQKTLKYAHLIHKPAASLPSSNGSSPQLALRSTSQHLDSRKPRIAAHHPKLDVIPRLSAGPQTQISPLPANLLVSSQTFYNAVLRYSRRKHHFQIEYGFR